MFDPITAREALLEIKHRAARAQGIERDRERASAVFGAIEQTAKAGLDRSGMENFELSDQLADRLAEAHKVLRELVNEPDHNGERPDLSEQQADRAREALTLPPDLEAMVERRIGIG